MIDNTYDYIIIDCSPSLGLMTLNVFACTDTVLIPVQASYLPVRGLQELFKTIGKVKRQLNPKISIEGILITMVDRRTRYHKDVIELLKNTYSDNVKIYDDVIPRSVKLEEATTSTESIFKYASKSPVAIAYRNIVEQI